MYLQGQIWGQSIARNRLPWLMCPLMMEVGKTAWRVIGSFGHLLEHCRNVPAMFLPIEVGNWLMYCFTQVLVKYPNEKYQKLVKNASFWLCKAYVRPM